MTMTLERYEAALAGAEPVTYHKPGCPAVLSLGAPDFPCDPNPKVCGAIVEHRLKLEAWSLPRGRAAEGR
jgi:hypothetical protein